LIEEFLFKTDSGCPKDTEIALFTLVNPAKFLRYDTPWSALPVSALAHSKRSLSPVDILELRDTYGQAQVCSKAHQGSSVDRPCQPSFCRQVLACTKSATSEYSIKSQCSSALLGPARESEVYPRHPQMKKRPAHISLIRPLQCDSAPLGAINTAATTGGKEIHSRGGSPLWCTAKTQP